MKKRVINGISGIAFTAFALFTFNIVYHWQTVKRHLKKK
jgi:hypothetical protein